MHALARWLSILFHPLLMPLAALALAFHLDFRLSFFLPPPLRWLTYGIVFALTVVFPLVSTFTMIRGGIVSSWRMPDRAERIGPYAMTLLYFGLCYYLLRRGAQHEITHAMIFGSVLALLLTLLITLRWKISAHMVGVGGLVGALCALSVMHGVVPLSMLGGMVLLAGALGTARLLDGGHSPGQVYAGLLLGGACVFGCMVRVLYI